MLLYPYRYNKLLRHYNPIDTTIYYVTIPLSIQTTMPLQSHWYNKPLRYYATIDTTIYYVIILPWYTNLLSYYTPTIRQATMILYSYWYNHLRILYDNRYSKPLCYYTPIDITTCYVTIISLIQQSITLLHSYWYSNLLWYYNTIDTKHYDTIPIDTAT